MSFDHQTDSEFVSHVPCGACGSKDNAGLYNDGHTFCFGCGHWEGEGEPPVGVKDRGPKPGLIEGQYAPLRARRITEDTCRKFGYTVGKHNGKTVQIATYRDKTGRPCAQKLRTADKKFSILGEAKEMTLFGSHLFSTGKLTICEGELDAMSLSQMQNHRWPVTSLPNGCASAKKAIMANWDYITSFKEVILYFDNDEPGRAAAIECAELLPVGLCKIASMSEYKDANEALVAGNAKAAISALFEAREHRPDGIVSAHDLRDVIGVSDAVSPITYPWDGLNKMSMGLRPASLVTVIAGSGVGKSTFIREIMYHIQQSGYHAGMIMLEETTKRTAQGLVGLHMNKNITVDETLATKEEIEEAYDDLLKGTPFYLYDHFGSTQLDTIIQRIRFMNKALGCQVICLDHVSILVSGMTGKVTDERRLVDSLATELRTEVQALGITLLLVSHLKRPSGDLSHEQGAKLGLNQIRSSHSLAQLSDQVIGLEVDRDDPTSGMRSIVMLKNHQTGSVGHCGSLTYDKVTGRLRDAETTFAF